MCDESEHSENKFCHKFRQMQKYFSCQLTNTPKAQKESQHSSQIKEFTTFSVANIEQRSGQEKNLFQMTCPILNLWKKQTDS